MDEDEEAIDAEDRDEGEDCGRWDQNEPSGMSRYCRLAGTAFCEFECPYSRTCNIS